MIKWPNSARKAMAAFFVKWNDIDVFVEDTARHAGTIYAQFVGRALEGRARVDSVFPLGDKQSVISACNADTIAGGKNRIYLVDGDLDIISAAPVPKMKRLYSHDVYHIENYFLCEDAFVKVLHEENPRLSEIEVRELLDFPAWLEEIKPFLYLFKIYGLSKSLDPSLPTVKMGVGLFSTSNKIDAVKVADFCATRIAQLESKFPLSVIEEKKIEIDGVVSDRKRYQDLVSARDYLLPALKWWVAAKGLQLPVGKESLLFRLSKQCALEPHAQFVDAIRAAAKS